MVAIAAPACLSVSLGTQTKLVAAATKNQLSLWSQSSSTIFGMNAHPEHIKTVKIAIAAGASLLACHGKQMKPAAAASLTPSLSDSIFLKQVVVRTSLLNRLLASFTIFADFCGSPLTRVGAMIASVPLGMAR